MKIIDFSAKNAVHMIGIGGCSMSSIAKYLLSRGWDVSGSDVFQTSTTKELSLLGCRIFIGHSESNLPKNRCFVIYNSAIKTDNVEVVEAKKRGLFVYDRMKFLAEIAKDFVVRVGVAGSHGKTTTTAMLGNILNQAQSNYLLHLGGEDNNLGNFFYTGKDIFLSEICEYKKNIKNIDVDIACVLNVDYDHVDCYSDISEVKQVMFDYLNRSKYRIINNDDLLLLEYSGGSLTYAINNNADVTAKNIRSTNFSTLFDVYYKNRFQFCVEISSTGIYNVYNALCAICVAMLLNISTSNIINGLKAFNGVKRRMEVIGEVNGARIICDYAHHPREIENAVACLKKTATGKVHVVFQPHTYSRTSKLIDDFVECFSKIENLCIYKTYPAREEYDYYGSAKNLFVKTKSATKYFEESDQLKNHLREEVGKNDTVLVLGAGDIYNIVKEMFN